MNLKRIARETLAQIKQLSRKQKKNKKTKYKQINNQPKTKTKTKPVLKSQGCSFKFHFMKYTIRECDFFATPENEAPMCSGHVFSFLCKVQLTDV